MYEWVSRPRVNVYYYYYYYHHYYHHHFYYGIITVLLLLLLLLLLLFKTDGCINNMRLIQLLLLGKKNINCNYCTVFYSNCNNNSKDNNNDNDDKVSLW